MLLSILVCLAYALLIRAYPCGPLFGGDPCEMEDHLEGICVPIFNCPMRIMEVQKGIRFSTTTRGRCSFSGHVEIVCCYRWDVTFRTTAAPLTTPRSPFSKFIRTTFPTTTSSRPTSQSPFSKISTTTFRTTTTTRATSQLPLKETTTTTFPTTTTSRWTPQPTLPKTTTTTMETINIDEGDRFSPGYIRPAEEACYENQRNGDDGKTITCNIINGEKAKAGEFPFIAALGYEDKKSEEYKLKYTCGGSLITTRHVLTAAHCIFNINGFTPVEVKLGAVHLNKTLNKAIEAQNSGCLNKTLDYEQNIRIAETKIHPRYRTTQKYHDIAVITLTTEAKITKYVKPICLQFEPISNLAVLVNTSRIVAGWGITDSEGGTTDHLLKTPNLQLIDKSACNVYYNISAFAKKLPNGIDDSLICMMDSKSDACQGDSGGPLVQKNNLLTPSLIGIVAFGSFCGSPIPGIYTNVHHYLDWIEEVVWPDKKLTSDRIFTSESPHIDIRFDDDY